MEEYSSHEVTRLLQAWGTGDQGALKRLMDVVYGELHKLASHYMAAEQGGHTLQTTALVNEVYVRLVDVKHVGWEDRAHFFALCAQLMRRVLIDFARSRNYQKRGGRIPHVELYEAATISMETGPEILAVDEALKSLAKVDRRKSQVVELRFFGGLTVDETATVLKVSPETVNRDWRLAKAWLLRELSGEGTHGS
jgi:RNA polymerase sigma-70 factor, ECF subfamily